MKKYIFPITLALLLGLFMSTFFVGQYNSDGSITISQKKEKIYYIRKGVYMSLDDMKNSMMDFENYIYSEENDIFYSYVGITKSKENAKKIKSYFSSKGYETNIEEKEVTNEGFLTILGQYDNILSETDNDQTIKVICNQVLAKYEETLD